MLLNPRELVADLGLTGPVRRDVELIGELPHGAEIRLLGAFTQSRELEVLEHPLTQTRGHVPVLSHEGEERASARDLGSRLGLMPEGRPTGREPR